MAYTESSPNAGVALIDELVPLIAEYCNHAEDSLGWLKQRTYHVIKRGTYHIERDSADRIIGYLEWDLNDGITHITKAIALAPGIMWKLRRAALSIRTNHWYFKRVKHDRWSHITRTRRLKLK